MSLPGIKVKLPHLNPQKMRRAVALMQGQPLAEDYLWPMLEVIGIDKIRWLIDNDQPFHVHLPQEVIAQLESPETARALGWAVNALTDEDLISFLPPEFQKMMKDPKALAWMQKEIVWLRRHFEKA